MPKAKKGSKMNKQDKKITDKAIVSESRRLIKVFDKFGGAVINEDIKLLKKLAKH